MPALLGGDLDPVEVLFPRWRCSAQYQGYLVLDLDPYLNADDATTLQIGKAPGTGNSAPSGSYLVDDLIGNVEGDDVETLLTLYGAQENEWFVRYVDIGGGTLDTDWYKFPVTDPGCAEPDDGSSGGGGGGEAGGGGDLI